MLDSVNNSDEQLLQHDEERAENGLICNYGTYTPIEGGTLVKQAPETKRVFKWSSWILASMAWLSMCVMGIYMLHKYLLPMLTGNYKSWPKQLFGNPFTTFCISIHFIGAATLLFQGNVQLLPSVRKRFPAFHRWSGRVYTAMSMVTAVGAFIYIVIHRMAGGVLMNIGFGSLGILMAWFTIETVRFARARRFDKHREWALRLYALVIASWLYRVEFGIWLVPLVSNHFRSFLPLFSKAMKLFFFIPNLLLVEYVLYVERNKNAFRFQVANTIIFCFTSIFLMYVTYCLWILPLLGNAPLRMRPNIILTYQNFSSFPN